MITIEIKGVIYKEHPSDEKNSCCGCDLKDKEITSNDQCIAYLDDSILVNCGERKIIYKKDCQSKDELIKELVTELKMYGEMINGRNASKTRQLALKEHREHLFSKAEEVLG